MKSRTKDFEVIFKWLVDEIKAKGCACERTIIYCQSRRVVSDIYAIFLDLLPSSCHQYVNMYHTNTQDDIQKHIIDSMGDQDGLVRILISTIAYGMGVDSKGVCTTIMCGHTVDLDDYMQMSGRIGRDGKQSVAVTLCYPGDSAGRVTATSMKDYLAGNCCRRKVIREVFGEQPRFAITPHNCCDICADSCQCGCDKVTSFEKNMRDALKERNEDREFPINIPSPSNVAKLERAMDEYRLQLLQDESEHIYCGADIVRGFSQAVSEQILKECNVEFDFRTFQHRYAFPSHQMALDVWHILCNSLERSFLQDDTTPYSKDLSLDEFSESDDDDDKENEYQEAVVVYSSSDSD